jgi:ribokinase
MMEAIADYGCEIVVVKRGEQGQYLYNRATRTHWEISAYPARVSDPTGAGDSFCGGFLAGYRQTYDPLQAVLYGSISASLTIEGSGAFYPLDALPGLAQARLDALKEGVRKV